MTITKIPVRGTELAYDLRGSGEPAVQLHGLTSSRRRDETLGLDLTAGAAGLRVLRYDARGHGLSGAGGGAAAYTWPELAADLLALLDDVFPGRPVHGVGQSMGAATLLHAALADPGRFASLALVIPPTAWGWRVAQAAAYLESAEVVEREGGAALAAATREQPLPPAVDPDRPFTVPDVPDAVLPTVFRGAAATDLPGERELGRIGVPVLVRAWTGDAAHPVGVAERLAELIPGAGLAVASTPAEVASWPGQIARAALSRR